MSRMLKMDDSNKENMKKNLRNKFFNHILNWNPDWFRNKKYQNKAPNVINNIALTAGQLHYNDVDEYQSVMFPQLIHEYWFTLQKDYEAYFKEKSHQGIEVETLYESSSLKKLVVSYSTRSSCCFGKNKQDCTHPRRGDLVEFLINRKKYFAYIINKKVKKNRGWYQFLFTLKLSISSTKILSHSQLTHATITSITFLEGCLSMVDALNCLETFPLCKFILSPNAEHYRMPSQLKLNLSDIATGRNPNPSQMRVISGVIEAIEQKTPKICLIQGPPGTGKSNTIVNLIASMIKRNNNIQFLVCAASNKAIDSLALQLMKIQPTLEDQNIPFRVVRVGNEEKMDEDVKNILLTATHGRKKQDVLRNSQVITSTLTSCYTSTCMRELFGKNSSSKKLVCIVDEAAQANELLTMVPLLLGVKCLFLVGDHQQLEPIVLSEKVKRYGGNSSLFGRAQNIFKNETVNPIAMLDTQYRMVKSISCWPNKYFYNSRLKDAASVNSLGICNYMLFNHNFPQTPNGHANEKEAELVVKLILFLREKLDLTESSNITIGVITPYHDQRALIQNLLDLKEKELSKKCQKLNKKTLKSKNCKIDKQKINETIETSTRMLKNLKLDQKHVVKSGNNVDKKVNEKTSILTEKYKDIEVNTVDSFQGSERDIIIISCVRSHELGFTKNPNRLNVSMTRAKHTLIMFGNFKAFQENSMWSNLIQDASKRNVLVKVNNSNAKSIFDKYVSHK